MEIKKLVVFAVVSITLIGMVLSAPTRTPQNSTRTPQNQTSSQSVLGSKSGAPLGLMMQRTTSLELQIIGMILYYAKRANNWLLQKYPFIDKLFLNPPVLRLGLITLTVKAQICPKMPLNYKLGILYPQLATFQGPLDFVYKYELNQTVAHNTKLVHALRLTRNYVYKTVASIRKMYPKGMTLPTGRVFTESDLDAQTKKTLKILQIRTKVPPTPYNVKIYRNFVIVNTLVEAINMMDQCIP